jgi:hypothetical protein
MKRLVPLALAVVALLFGCRGSGGGPGLTLWEAKRYKVPGGTNEFDTFVFRDRDGKYLYAVLRYSSFNENELIEWSGGQANPGQVSIESKPVSVPQDGAAYVVDPGLRLHRLPVTAEQLRPQLPKVTVPQQPSPEFFENRLWREELLPVLKQHKWRRPANDKP